MELDLFEVADQGDLARLESLAKDGVNIDAESGDRQTDMWWAARTGQTEVLEIMLQHGADTRRPIVTRETMMAAVLGRQIGVIDLLFARRAVWMSSNGVFWLGQGASMTQIDDIIQRLLDHEALVDASPKTGALGPLYLASRYGKLETTKVLLSNGAYPNLDNRWSGTALLATSMGGHLPLVQLLLEHGADKSITYRGFTPQEAADEKGYGEIVALLDAWPGNACRKILLKQARTPPSAMI